MTDTELLDYVETQIIVILTDDAGNWAAVTPGLRDIPEAPGEDIDVTITIPRGAWRKSLRGAIMAYAKEDEI